MIQNNPLIKVKYSIWLPWEGRNLPQFKECLDALLNQKRKDLEIIISYSDKRIPSLLNNYQQGNNLFFLRVIPQQNKIKKFSQNSNGDYVIVDINSNFILFKSVLRNVFEHHQKKTNKKDIFWYGSKLNGLFILPKDLCKRYSNLNSLIKSTMKKIDKINFYFDLPLGRRYFIDTDDKSSEKFEEFNKKYVRDISDLKIKKDILIKEFKIPEECINISLINLLFRKKFDIHYYSINWLKKINFCTITNYAMFYEIMPFKKMRESKQGYLLDLIYLKKPNFIDFQIDHICVSSKINKNLMQISKKILSGLFSSKEFLMYYSLYHNNRSIMLHSEKGIKRDYYKKTTNISNDITDLFHAFKLHMGTYREINVIHSSGIAFRNKAFLFVGYKNAGKSTTAIRLYNLIKESKYICDDICSLMFSKNSRTKALTTPWPMGLRKKSNGFFKGNIHFSSNLKKGIILNQGLKFADYPVEVSTVFFLKRTDSKNTLILEADNNQITEFTKMHSRLGDKLMNVDFHLFKKIDPSIKFKLVLLGKNIKTLVDYIKNS